MKTITFKKGVFKTFLFTAIILLLSVRFFSVQAQDCDAPAAPYVNWSGCDKIGVDLSSADLSSANFTNANLTNANLSGANLIFADLSSANMLNANLPGANLPFANLSSANLSIANLSGAELTAANLSSVIFNYAIMDNANLTDANLSNANLTYADLTGATLTGVVSGGIIGTPSVLPDGWVLVNGYLVGPGANLNNANLTNANFTNANLSGANLSGANLSGADLSFANLPDANLSIADLSSANMLNANLIDANLIGAVLIGANLTDAILDFAYLSGANLTGANLSGARLMDANLTGSDLSGANLYNANLYGANLSEAVLTNANLTGANLTGANLTGATLTGVVSGGITGNPSALPLGWALVNGYLVGPGANLTNAILTGANLSDANLTGATLTGVVSGGIIGTPSVLPDGWVLVNGYLVGPGANLSNANLSNANLTNANLTNANLTNANLTGANLTNADLTGATLTGVVSGGITGNPSALPAGWALVNGYLQGPDCSAPAAPNVNWSGCNKSGIILFNQNLTGANLTNAILVGTEIVVSNLSGADLTGANLFGGGLGGTNLAGANLTGANLNGLTSGGIIGTPLVLPSGWALVTGYLVGPGANLYNVNLSGADLTNFNLTGADLWNANLSSANLTGANLTNANFNGANLTGATLTGVVSGGITGNPSALPAGWALVNGYLVATALYKSGALGSNRSNHVNQNGAIGVSSLNSNGRKDTFFPTVTIGTQIWSSTNLDVTTYRDGTPIPEVQNSTAWAGLTTGAWCYYNNNPANGAIYGKLYNWYAVAGIYDAASLADPALRKQFAPTGWHVPTDPEWSILINYLDPNADGGNTLPNVAGGKMKSTGTIQAGTGLWQDSNTDATNASGFTGLPAGCCNLFGTFDFIGLNGGWWSSSENSTSSFAWYRYLYYGSGYAVRSEVDMNYGFSVRCLRD